MHLGPPPGGVARLIRRQIEVKSQKARIHIWSRDVTIFGWRTYQGLRRWHTMKASFDHDLQRTANTHSSRVNSLVAVEEVQSLWIKRLCGVRLWWTFGSHALQFAAEARRKGSRICMSRGGRARAWTLTDLIDRSVAQPSAGGGAFCWIYIGLRLGLLGPASGGVRRAFSTPACFLLLSTLASLISGVGFLAVFVLSASCVLWCPIRLLSCSAPPSYLGSLPLSQLPPPVISSTLSFRFRSVTSCVSQGHL